MIDLHANQVIVTLDANGPPLTGRQGTLFAGSTISANAKGSGYCCSRNCRVRATHHKVLPLVRFTLLLFQHNHRSRQARHMNNQGALLDLVRFKLTSVCIAKERRLRTV